MLVTDISLPFTIYCLVNPSNFFAVIADTLPKQRMKKSFQPVVLKCWYTNKSTEKLVKMLLPMPHPHLSDVFLLVPQIILGTHLNFRTT